MEGKVRKEEWRTEDEMEGTSIEKMVYIMY